MGGVADPVLEYRETTHTPKRPRLQRSRSRSSTPFTPLAGEHGSSRWRRLAWRPRLWVHDEFVSREDCAVVRAAIERGAHGEGGAAPRLNALESTVFDNIARRIGALLGTPPHSAETPLAARKTPPALKGSDELPLGLHVDLFQGSARRFVTGLLYLTSDVEGGATAFPLAVPLAVGADTSCGDARKLDDKSNLPSRWPPPSIIADAQLLLDQGFFHTTAATTPKLSEDGGYDEPPEEVAAAATRLLAWASPRGSSPLISFSSLVAASAGGAASSTCPGLRVHPQEGRLLLFFTRDVDGRVDPHSWHGGCAVGAHGAPKFTAQAFKEVPPLSTDLLKPGSLDVEEFENYIQSRILEFEATADCSDRKVDSLERSVV